MNRIWLITGVSSGLGKAIAEEVIQNGDFVIATFRKTAQVNDFNARYKGKAKAFLLDISDMESIPDCVADIKAEFDTLDILVNNAGVGFVGAIEEASMDEIRKVFEVNFFGALSLTQSILPMMRRQGSGRIIQISSHGGLKAFAGFGIYNASKFALEGFSEAMAQEVEPLGIKTTIVEPGPFRTKFAGPTLGAAVREIDDYAETAGAFRKKLKSVDGLQEGDPQKAATAILEISDMENPPLRLPLGKTALATIEMKLESVKKDLDATRDIAENAVFS
ncbi:MAG: oxidoreductase [Bacteroidota bacterium]